ncbi:MAG: acyltransferase domain-containing protein, partial [Acidobacteriota bacterium]
MIGHSIGEYVAACLAGVFSLEDALGLVAVRGRLMQSMAPGGMLAVSAAPERLEALLAGDVVVAALNGPELTVVSGPIAGIDALSERLASAGMECQRLHTSHAFHSPMMDGLLPEFEAHVRRTRRSGPRIPFVSNVTGTWITAEQATDSSYWAMHLRRPVRFAEGVAALREDAGRVLLEVGPGTTLSTLARRQSGAGPGREVVNSGRHPRESQSDSAVFAAAIARLWVAGIEIDWAQRSAGEERNRVPLPGYPFERQRYWIEAPRPGARAAVAPAGKSPRIEDWFYVPSWKVQPAAKPGDAARPQHWLLLTQGGGGLGEDVARCLERSGHTVSLAARSSRFVRRAEHSYEVEPTETGFRELFAALDREGRPATAIAHLWTLEQPPAQGDRAPFHELMALLRELGRAPSAPVELLLLGSGLHGVPGGAAPNPAEAMLLGPCRVAPQEYLHVTCRTMEVTLPEGAWQQARIAGQIAGEIVSGSRDLNVAFRGLERLVLAYERVTIGADAAESPSIRQGGAYVITGGLGEVGLTLAEFLAREHRARLVMVGRASVPPRDQWPALEA